MVIAPHTIGSGDGPSAGQAGLAGHYHLWLLRQHLGRKMGPWLMFSVLQNRQCLVD